MGAGIHARHIGFARVQAMALLVLVFAQHSSAGEELPARLTGRVLDEHGTGLAGVVVSVASKVGGGLLATSLTDSAGTYSIPDLRVVDEVTVTVRLQNYATIVAGPIRLEAGRTTLLDITLRKASDAEERIQVEAEGEIVDTSSASTTVTYGTEMLEALPLLGRRFSDVLTLAPGVTDSDGDGNPNVRGARDTGLQVRLDGTNITDPLTGHVGQDINVETIQELDIITGGATAEYGRADGGFANIITKSGGNEIEGSLKWFYRSDFLDGDGATNLDPSPHFTDNDAFFTIGGPLRRDHAWYFASLERLDEELPIIFPQGGFAVQSKEGWRAFAKTTLQTSVSHKLALQLNHDPLEFAGNNIGPFVSSETDYVMRTRGTLPQFTWTAILSPSLLMQTVFSHLAGSLEIDPVSNDFDLIAPDVIEFGGNRIVPLPCLIPNCFEEPSLRRLFRPSRRRFGAAAAASIHEEGPYSLESDRELDRTTMKTDLSYAIEDMLGQHALKSGFELNVEKFSESSANNPVLTDDTCDFVDCGVVFFPIPPPGTRIGSLLMQVFEPAVSTLSADGLSAGAYLQDGWKALPSLTISAGLRIDLEQIEAEGFTDLNPLPEAREALRRFDLICDAVGSTCTSSREPGRRIGPVPATVTPPAGHPALELDLDGDGVLDFGHAEKDVVLSPFARRENRLNESFLITNTNVAPRLGVSWDPWSDGKTRVFGSWGKFYDRLFLGAAATGQQPVSHAAQWELGPVFIPGQGFTFVQANPGDPSLPLEGDTVPQVDRDLRTPYTIEWTMGLERELAPEWSVLLTYVRRRGRDLLQDVDINHITCKGFDTTFGVDPMDVCGDAGRLELDRFGDVESGSVRPNRAPDLYHLNPNFNQILHVGNFNESEYTAAEMVLRKRLKGNWEMLLGYTYSRSEGDAESLISQQGNDPGVSDKVRGFLDYDQRHVVKWQGAGHLRGGLVLGGTLQWASGLPYTLVSFVDDRDDVGNVTPQRVFSVTGLKNDQRNSSQLILNGHVEKRLRVGQFQLSAFLDAENLLNENDLRILQVDAASRETVDGSRRFGRRWQIGVAVYF